MGTILKEETIEDWISQTLEEAGYLKKDNSFQGNFQENVIDFDLLEKQLYLINKDLDSEYILEAIKKIKYLSFSDSLQGNFETLNFLKNGIGIHLEKIDSRTRQVYLIDYNNINNNKFEYIRQLKISNQCNHIIPDILIYINGLPLSIIELKAPEARETLSDAYNQVCNYAKSNNKLMYWNVLSLVSNAATTRYGAYSSSFSHWYSWKKINEEDDIEQDYDVTTNLWQKNYRKNILGIFSKRTFFNILKNYIFFAKVNNTYIKYIPAYHQYFATEKTVKSIEKAKFGLGGVVWHTQGSGKSVTMLFLAKRIKTYFSTKNYKLVYVTDRNELNDQLYKRFSEASETYLISKPKKIESRSSLREVLSNEEDFGIYITTIQKFTESTEPLSKKDNIIVIADEAHRSHNNIETEYEIDKESQEIIEKDGYAKYIRDAFPNAIFVGFTGTPLMGNKKTTNVFGDYIDKYTMNQAVLDGSTVPIHYEKRRLPIIYDKCKIEEIDELYNYENSKTGSEYLDNAKYEHIKKKLINIANLLSNHEVIKTLVSDFWLHYDSRKKALNGKALFVAFNRHIAFEIYKEMIKQRPNWEDKIKLIVTRSNKDSQELANAIPSDDQKEKITIDFKKDNSKIKIAIVVDMWLTGFDVPDLDTLYLFKVIKWHNLMQTIARVNRTYAKGELVKNDGLVVDYIGIWKHISDALKQYADQKNKNFDIEEVKKALIDKCMEIQKRFFSKTDLINKWVTGNKDEKYETLIMSLNYIKENFSQDIDLYFDMVSKVSRWYKLCSQILTTQHKLEAQLFILLKNFIRNQEVEEAIDVQETIKKLKDKMDEIIKTGGIEVSTITLDGRKDLAYVSHLLEKELNEVQKTNKLSYLKAKALENEVKQQIRNLSKISPIKSQQLSKDLIYLVDRFEKDKNAEQFLANLIKMAKSILENQKLLNEVGDETMQLFYSILADDRFKMMNYHSDVLRKITEEVMETIKDNITSQWWNNKTLRDKINSKIKLLLNTKYRYPPDDCKEIITHMMDAIDETIKINKKYFIKEEDR